MRLTVAKVGGSLFDLPDLRDRLQCWLRSVEGRVLLVPGGGAGADVVRRLDTVHSIGEDRAHWLALRVLSVNAHLLSAITRAPVVAHPDPEAAGSLVLDPCLFCQYDAGRPGAVPHCWQATSDTIAARVAEVARADLVLLKSTDLAEGTSWTDAAVGGLVDPLFPASAARLGRRVRWVNLRRRILPSVIRR